MNTNLKKLTLAIMTVAMLFALALPAAAAEAPAHYDDDLFTWDENGSLFSGGLLERLEIMLSGIRIQDEEIPLSAGSAIRIPTVHDDDLFTWDEAGTDLLGSISSLLDTIG